MTFPDNKTLLFRKKEYSSNITRKVIRYFLEKQLISLNQEHGAHRRQVAIFSFDYVSTGITLDGIYEVDELAVFFQWLKSLDNNEIFNGLAIDIGANIGNHSLYFSDYFKQVISFEPHPLTYKLLSVNSE